MYHPGETVIVTQGDTHRVGVVLDTFLHNKSRLYDVLLENRSAICKINTSAKAKTRINKEYTNQLCNKGDKSRIKALIPYKDLVENDLIPYIKA